MAFVCSVCYNVDYEVDNETGSMRCNGCNTLSQDYVNEALGDEAAGVTMFMSRNVAGAGFVRESGNKLRVYDENAAAIEKESIRKLRGIRLEDAALALSLAYCDYLQTILEWQCQVLIKEMGVSEELTGVAGELWFKFVEKSEVLDPSLVQASSEERGHRRSVRYRTGNDESNPANRINKGVEEMQGEEDMRGGDEEGEEGDKGEEEEEEEPDLFGGKEDGKEGELGEGYKFADWHDAKAPKGGTYAHLWVSEMKSRIPLAVTLAILFLATHWLREPILPTDLVQLQLENRLPYMVAWKLLPEPQNFSGLPELDRLLQVLREHGIMKPLSFCSARKIEFWAAEVASRLAIDLPPVNYHLLALRFMQDLRLPLPPLVPLLDRLLDLLIPSPLWITTWVGAVPARVTVMAMVVLTLKLHYGLTTAFSEGGETSQPAQPPHPPQPPICTWQSAKWCKFRGLEEGTRVNIFGNVCWVKADDTEGGEEWDGASIREQEEVVLGMGVRHRVVFFPHGGKGSYSKSEVEAYFGYSHKYVLRSVNCPSYMADESSKFWKAFKKLTRGEGGNGEEEWEKVLRGRDNIAEEMKRVGCFRAPPIELKRGQYVRYTTFKGPRIFSEVVAHPDFFVVVHTCARVVGVPWKTLFSVVCENEEKLVELEFRLEKMARKSDLTPFVG